MLACCMVCRTALTAACRFVCPPFRLLAVSSARRFVYLPLLAVGLPYHLSASLPAAALRSACLPACPPVCRICLRFVYLSFRLPFVFCFVRLAFCFVRLSFRLPRTFRLPAVSLASSFRAPIALLPVYPTACLPAAWSAYLVACLPALLTLKSLCFAFVVLAV